MNVILFGATGMVGQGVLRECLLAPDVQRVLTIGRTPTGHSDPKLTELARPDLLDYRGLDAQLSGYDACFFCLGVSSYRMAEESYRRITYTITLAAARTLVRLNPNMTFIYVSGQGTDSSEKGRITWARIKGQTENALLELPFKGAYMFRPGMIQPLDGIVSRTRAYRIIYTLFGPFMPLLKAAFPKSITNTRQIGQAMLAIARHGAPKHILESAEINAISQ